MAIDKKQIKEKILPASKEEKGGLRHSWVEKKREGNYIREERGLFLFSLTSEKEGTGRKKEV